ncbi:MAG: ABC transporter permease, partial [Alphaproteobacteria bacterium]|nr:ABC transporter permease [Alphaproteobacteria bacterium]
MTVAAEDVGAVPARNEETPLRRFWSEFAESRMAVLGLIGFVILVGLALLAPWIAPQNPYDLKQL